jgi:hypothetical protein
MSFQLVESINPDYDSFQLALVIVWLAVVLILIYIFREKRKKTSMSQRRSATLMTLILFGGL